MADEDISASFPAAEVDTGEGVAAAATTVTAAEIAADQEESVDAVKKKLPLSTTDTEDPAGEASNATNGEAAEDAAAFVATNGERLEDGEQSVDGDSSMTADDQVDQAHSNEEDDNDIDNGGDDDNSGDGHTPVDLDENNEDGENDNEKEKGDDDDDAERDDERDDENDISMSSSSINTLSRSGDALHSPGSGESLPSSASSSSSSSSSASSSHKSKMKSGRAKGSSNRDGSKQKSNKARKAGGGGSMGSGGDLNEDLNDSDLTTIPTTLNPNLNDSHQELTAGESERQRANELLDVEVQEFINALGDDASMKKFKSEYEKLHKALLKSRDIEKRLMRKCKELGAEVVANSSKVQGALKMTQDDRSTIAALKKEIKRAWNLVEASNQKESQARETIQHLRSEITVIKSSSGGQPNSGGVTFNPAANNFDLLAHDNVHMAELIKAKEELLKEKEEQGNQIFQYRSEISDMIERIRQLESEKADTEQEVQNLKDTASTRKSEADREIRVKERLEKDLKECRTNMEIKNAEIRARQEQVQKAKEEVSRLDQMAKESKIQMERAQKEHELLNNRILKLQQDYEEQMMVTQQLVSESHQKSSEIKIKDDDLFKVKENLKQVSRLKEGLMKKIKGIEDQRTEIEQSRDSLKGMIHALEREIETHKKQSESDRKNIEDLMRERDILNKNLLKAAGSTLKQSNLVKLHEQSKRYLEQEIAGYKEEAAKQRKLIYQLEKERDRYINEAADIQSRCVGAQEEVKIREMQILDYKKKIAEVETKLKQQQNLYEAVRSDRNLYSKNLIESQDEISEMKRKLKIMNHQIDQLKEEITSKESALVKEHFEHLKVEKEKEGLKAELNKLRQQNDLAQQYIQSQNAEEQKLRHIIAEADLERLKQKKEYDTVIQERDILGTQLIRRNDELALLYEKIKIQQSTLNKGEIQYRERLEDIRVLKLEIKKLRREKAILQNTTANVESLRNEVYRLQRELLRERTRVKALEEELENPMNIHRWRKLEGSDPNTFEMVQKIQTLQKRLISKTEEVVEKELQLQEKEKLYIELKNILARQPGPEFAEQLNVYQQSLREKTKQMKAMVSELNMYQAQANEYKYEIERMNRDMVEIKKKYFEQKRKDQLQRSLDVQVM